MANNKNNVSVGKPKTGGAVFTAPTGTTVPTDATTALAEAFICLGYISDAGVRHSTTRETSETKAWGGDTVLVPQTSYSDRFTMGFLEVLNPEVQKLARGASNVTGTVAGTTGMHVAGNGTELPECVMIIEEILTGNTAKRTVLPCAKPLTLSEITDVDSGAIVYELEIGALPDASENTFHEYYKAST